MKGEHRTVGEWVVREISFKFVCTCWPPTTTAGGDDDDDGRWWRRCLWCK